MHCHSTASQWSRLGVQRALGLPECATPPEEVYELAKRRGMDFVTITDHDTIAGVLQIAERPDVFVSEELTACFRGERQAVHVLCYGITDEDHAWLQAHRGDVELCAAYMYDRDIACALAHPYYTVEAPLTARHRRRLAELFGVWEIRNGARPRDLNHPAATYVATRDGIGIGGSDDHAGVDIGRTFTEAPPALTPAEFLAHMRAGNVLARGEEGSAGQVGARRDRPGRPLARTRSRSASARPDPGRVMRWRAAAARGRRAPRNGDGGGVSPDDARCLLRAWLAAVELDNLDEHGLIAYMQEERFSHSDLYRRARRAHERKLSAAVEVAFARRAARPTWRRGRGLFEACMAAIPYAPATAFLANEQAKLAAIPYKTPPIAAEGALADAEKPRVAILADGIGSTHGVTPHDRGDPPARSARLRDRGRRHRPRGRPAPAGRCGDRRAFLPRAEDRCAEPLRRGAGALRRPFRRDPRVLPGARRCRRGARRPSLGVPLLGSYHTELSAYAGLRSGERIAEVTAIVVSAFYNACDLVLSPSAAADARWRRSGWRASGCSLGPWRGHRALRPRSARAALAARRDGRHAARRINVLYSGRITREKGIDLLADAFLLGPRAGAAPASAARRRRTGGGALA